MTPEPMVLLPSRIAKRAPSAKATGLQHTTKRLDLRGDNLPRRIGKTDDLDRVAGADLALLDLAADNGLSCASMAEATGSDRNEECTSPFRGLHVDHNFGHG